MAENTSDEEHMNQLDKEQQEEQLAALRRAIAVEKSFVTEAIVTIL